MKSKRHLSRVAELPCVVCGAPEVQVHHLIGRQLNSMARKASDYLTIPLCFTHHSELHRIGWREWEHIYGSQVDHLSETLRGLFND